MSHDAESEESAQRPLEPTAREGNGNGSRPTTKDVRDPDERIGFVRGMIIAVSLGVMMFFQAVNISMMTTIGSAVVESLDAYSNVSWLTSAYMIAISSVTPLGGQLSKIFGSPSCLLFASVVFSIGGIIAAVSPSLPVFLLGRVLSGIGAALVFGVATVFCLEIVGKERRGFFVGLINAGYTVGVATGAVVAGALESKIGWRGVFWLQIPFVIPAGLGIFFSAPRSSDRLIADQSFIAGLQRIDYLGVLTLTSAIVLMLYSLAAEKVNYVTLVISIAIFIIFFLVEARIAKEPIVPVDILKSKGIVFTFIATMLQMMARWSILFMSPVYSIACRGWSPGVAGLMLVPTNAGFAIGGLLVGLVHIRHSKGYYFTTLLAFVCFSATMFVFAHISTPHPRPGLYVIVIFINGFVTGATMNYSFAHAMHLSKTKAHPIVTSLMALSRTSAGSFGSSIGGGLFGRVLKANLEIGFEGQDFEGKDELINHLLGSPVLASSLHGQQRQVARDSYAAATSALFLGAGFIAIAATFMQALTGWKAAEDDDADETRPLLQSDE